MKKSNVIIFSEHFINRRIIKEGKIYSNEIVGECCECSGLGISTETGSEMICIGCDGTGIIYYGKENINWNIKIGV